MTNAPDAPQSYATPPQPPAQPQYAATAPEAKQKNTVGLIGFIIAVVGFIFACIPGALIVGWILLPVGFILSIVGLCLSGKKKGLSVAGLIISVVGTIVGFVVFFTVVVTGIDEAISGGEITVEQSTTDEKDASADEESAAPAEGTRENPYPIGSAITQGDWTVTVNSVNLDATQALADENLFNEAAPDGSTYILVNVTATYIGADAAGDSPFVSVDYVTAGGNTISMTDTFAVAPDAFPQMTTLYEGASATGNISLAVPTEGITEGVLAVSPHLLGDTVFVAVQ